MEGFSSPFQAYFISKICDCFNHEIPLFAFRNKFNLLGKDNAFSGDRRGSPEHIHFRKEAAKPEKLLPDYLGWATVRR